VVDELVRLVEAMDVPERVILIEAKIVETTVDDKSTLGSSGRPACRRRCLGK